MKMNEKQSNEVIRRLKEDVEFFKKRKLPFETQLFNIEIVIQLIEQQQREIEHLKFDVKHMEKNWRREGEQAERYEQALKSLKEEMLEVTCDELPEFVFNSIVKALEVD
jgi:hypothetical protein